VLFALCLELKIGHLLRQVQEQQYRDGIYDEVLWASAKELKENSDGHQQEYNCTDNDNRLLRPIHWLADDNQHSIHKERNNCNVEREKKKSKKYHEFEKFTRTFYPNKFNNGY
jgi:hypothetical protein